MSDLNLTESSQLLDSMQDGDFLDLRLPADDVYPEINVRLRKPTIDELSMIFTEEAKDGDVMKAMVKMLRTIFITGDEWIFNDYTILAACAASMNDLVKGYPIDYSEKFNNTTKRVEVTVTIKDEKLNPTFKILKPSPEHMNVFNTYASTNFLVASRELFKACHIEGDKNLLDKTEYLVSTMSAVAKIMKIRTEELEKHWGKQN